MTLWFSKVTLLGLELQCSRNTSPGRNWTACFSLRASPASDPPWKQRKKRKRMSSRASDAGSEGLVCDMLFPSLDFCCVFCSEVSEQHLWTPLLPPATKSLNNSAWGKCAAPGKGHREDQVSQVTPNQGSHCHPSSPGCCKGRKGAGRKILVVLHHHCCSAEELQLLDAGCCGCSKLSRDGGYQPNWWNRNSLRITKLTENRWLRGPSILNSYRLGKCIAKAP